MGGLEESIVIGQFLQLAHGGLGQNFSSISDIHTPQSCHSIQETVAIGIPEIDSFRPGDHPCSLFFQGFGIGKWMKVVGTVTLL